MTNHYIPNHRRYPSGHVLALPDTQASMILSFMVLNLGVNVSSRPCKQAHRATLVWFSWGRFVAGVFHA